MRSFLSLLISFALISLGDVLNLAVANNISFAAIGVMGAYYTINWFASEFSQFGIYTYRVERKDEWQYLQVALVSGLSIGLIVSLVSPILPDVFGIDAEQKTMLSSMLAIFVLALPVKACSQALFEITRLRGNLSAYRHAVIAFYVVSIPMNLIMFFTAREVWCVVVANMFGNIAAIVIAGRVLLKELPHFSIVRPAQWKLVARYGAPLVGERLIQRMGLTVYGICASYLPAELYAIHSVCLQAVYMGDIGDSAYSAALLVLVPDKSMEENSRERYVSERARMIAYRRKTAWVAILLSFAASYIAAVIMHAETPLLPVMWFTFFYAFSFIPMAISTPGKDFLTIQKRPKQVMLSTLCGVPFYMGFPLIAIFLVMPYAPEAALYLFGLTGTAQIVVRAILYTVFIKRLDKQAEVSTAKLRESARQVVI